MTLEESYEYIGIFEIQDEVYANFRLNKKTKELEIKLPFHEEYRVMLNLKAENKAEAKLAIDNWRFRNL